MFVLGVDPGLTRCGYCCLDVRRNSTRAVALGVIRTDPAWPVPERLAELQREMRELMEQTRPGVVAIERVLFQVNVRTAMTVGQASGIIMATAAALGADVIEYSPNEVKQTVAGYGAANKAQVAQMVQTLLGLDNPPRPADAADAAAVALCHAAHAPMRRATASANANANANARVPS